MPTKNLIASSPGTARHCAARGPAGRSLIGALACWGMWRVILWPVWASPRFARGSGSHAGRPAASDSGSPRTCPSSFPPTMTRGNMLWIAMTEPVEIPGHHPWMVASSRGSDAWHAVQKLEGYKELAERTDDPVGFTFFPWGAVAGGAEHTEDWAGAGAPQVVRKSEPNPHFSEPSVIVKDDAMSRALPGGIGDVRLPYPFSEVVFVLCCSSCRRIFLSFGGPPPDEH